MVDFGIARAHGSLSQEMPALGIDLSSKSAIEKLTQVGAILGTLGYMSPEQVRGEPADARSDQFSFCASLYEALYGHLPFFGRTVEEYAQSVLSDPLQMKARTTGGIEVPIVLKRALQRGLSRSPSARFESMSELMKELQQALLPDADSETARHSKRNFLYAIIASFLISCGSVMWALRGTVQSDLRPPLIIAGVFFVATATVVWRFRHQIHRQPGYRRMSYFLLTTLTYLLVGRTMGLLLGVPAERFLIQETLSLAALFASEAQQVGRRYLWLVLLCVVSVGLQIAWPEARKIHLNLTYMVMLGGAVYFHFRRGRDSGS